MKRLLIQGAVAVGTLATLTMAHLGFATRAEADDRRIWGISTLGETCTGTCGRPYICCTIVINMPDS